MAWDPVARKKVWEIQENFPVWSGTLVTAGDVAFYGTMDRWFKAVDAKDGQHVWQFHAGSGIIGQPVTYQGADGTAVCRDHVGRRRLARCGSPMPSSTRACAMVPWASSAPRRTCRPTPPAAARSTCSRCRRAPRPSRARAPAPPRRRHRSAGAMDNAKRACWRAALAGAHPASGMALGQPARSGSAPIPTTCLSRMTRVRDLRTSWPRCRARSGREGRLYLVGAAPRLHPQHAEGRPLRRRHGRAAGTTTWSRPPALLPFDLCLRLRAPTAVSISARSATRACASSSVGVHLIGDDGFNTPPAHALGEEGIVGNVVGYTIYGDYRTPDPPSATDRGRGDRAHRRGGGLGSTCRILRQRCRTCHWRVRPIADTDALRLVFQYDVAMAVRKGDQRPQARLDR